MNVLINKAINPSQLNTELLAAFPQLSGNAGGLPTTNYSLTPVDATHWILDVPAEITGPTLNNLINNHNAGTLTPLQQQEDGDRTSLQALRNQYQTLKSGLSDIRADMTNIQTTPNPTTANLASLVQVANGLKLMAADVTKMTNGMDRLLDTIATVVGRQV